MRHGRKGLNPVKVPFAMKVADPILREWVGDVNEAIRGLAARSPQAAPLRIGGGGGASNRFRFGGLFKDSANKWRVRIHPGCIEYHEIFTRGDFETRKSKAQYVRGVFPTIDFNGDDVRIDDPSKPALELGDRDSASVWVVAKKDKCNSSSLADGRLVISDRDEDPDIESSEDAFLIVDFDVEEDDDGKKRATEVYKYLQSDLIQHYACDKGDDSSDSWLGSDMDSSSDFTQDSSSGVIDSTPSGSSDEDDDGDGKPECDIDVVAGWVNPIACFPAREGPDKCKPKGYNFTIRVKFIFRQPFGGKPCEGYVFGASLQGGIIRNPGPSDTTTEFRWRDDPERELTWWVEDPPACQKMVLLWRVKAFQAKPDFGETEPPEDQGCCNLLYASNEKNPTYVIQRDAITTGPWNTSKTKMPNVCGCTCSSSLVTPPEGGGGGA